MRSSLRNGWILLVVSLSALPACGDDAEEPPGGRVEIGVCPADAACGGDPTGSWKLEEFCQSPVIPLPGGEECLAEVDYSGYSITGDIEFREDKTYTWVTTVEGASTTVYSPSCMSRMDESFTCADFDALLKRGVEEDEELALESAECHSVGEDCACYVVYRETTVTQMGTWSVAGATLTLDDGERSRDLSLCAEGSTFTMGLLPPEGEDRAYLKSYLRYTRK